MPADRVIQFRERQLPKPACAKSTLPDEVALSLERSIEKLPRLAQRNPNAALLIERHIDDWMVPPSSPEGGGPRRQARAHLKLAEVRAVITVVSAQAALVDRLRRLK
jgi:hypothetical protein